jgi:transposase
MLRGTSIRNSRQVLGAVKNVTVSLSGGKWFVSIQTEREVEQPLPRGGAVGIDLGVARFARLSDGTFYAPLNSFKRHATALRKGQQAMCRKQKFSHNWNAINILRAGHARCACQVSDAVRSPAAGTHRSDSGAAQCRP